MGLPHHPLKTPLKSLTLVRWITKGRGSDQHKRKRKISSRALRGKWPVLLDLDQCQESLTTYFPLMNIIFEALDQSLFSTLYQLDLWFAAYIKHKIINCCVSHSYPYSYDCWIFFEYFSSKCPTYLCFRVKIKN